MGFGATEARSPVRQDRTYQGHGLLLARERPAWPLSEGRWGPPTAGILLKDLTPRSFASRQAKLLAGAKCSFQARSISGFAEYRSAHIRPWVYLYDRDRRATKSYP